MFMSSYFYNHLPRFLTVNIIILSLSSVNNIFAQNIYYVPADYSTIQDALDAAAEGDTIIVAPGTYIGELLIADKSVFLASYIYTTGDDSYIAQTILDGNGGANVVHVNDDVAVDTSTIMGFTLHNANNGVYVNDGKANIISCHVFNCTDGLEYRNGTGGECKNNILELNSDDGIDLNYDVDILVQDNIIRNNDGDGVEIRLEPYTGTLKSYIFRGNLIENNDNYGIQLIDYNTVSDRIFIFEENLIINNGEVGIGCISEPEGVQFEGVGIPERIYIFNNTFYGNLYGITGGDSLVAVNNIFVNNSVLAMKSSAVGSIASYNILWNNGDDFENCNVDNAHTFYEDPQLDAQFELESTSPAIDEGASSFIWNSELVLDRQPSSYNGEAPDLGAFEFGDNDDPLFVELANFNVRYYENYVLLNWFTESEINNIGFEILRADEQEGDYLILSSYKDNFDLTGQGNSSTRYEYTFIDVMVEPGKTYWYKLTDLDYSGVKTFHDVLSVTIPSETHWSAAIKLYPNYPNPFNPSTTIKFEITKLLSAKTPIELVIYNSIGHIVKKMIQNIVSPGTYEVQWDGTNEYGDEIVAGTYFANLKTDQFSQTIKLFLIK